MLKQILSVIGLLILMLLPGCGDFSSADMGAGVTPGGVQDNGYVRELIENGAVPAPELFTYEGFFSEHDFSIPSSPCESLICFNPALSSIKIDDQPARHFIQLLMGSNIDLNSYKRPPTDLMVVLDTSGSMSGEPISRAREALKEVVKQMGQGDQLGIITFSSSYTIPVPLQPVSGDNADILKQIDQITAGGGTDIESPLTEAYRILEQNGKNSNKRVLLITDARPNINGTGEGEFTTLIRDYESQIGITVFGVGYDLGFDLAKIISETVGGNYIYLETGEALLKRIRDDFPLLIAPLATDFEVKLSRSDRFNIVNTYGLPEIEGETITLKAKSLFLSRTKGAMAIELTYIPGSDTQITPMLNDRMVQIKWSYKTTDGESISGDEWISFIPPTQNNDIYYHRLQGAEKLVILIDMIETFKDVTATYRDQKEQQAKDDLEEKIEHFRSILQNIDDDQLQRELKMMEQLQSNMSVPQTEE